MIFAAVGTQKFPMDRLLIELDRLAGAGEISEPIFIQTGASTYAPAHCQSSPFLSKEEMAAKVAECSVMISHGGVGSILMALKAGKKVIVIPRKAKFGEHVDDHQIEIAESFANAGYVKMVEEAADLQKAIRDCSDWQPLRFESNKQRFSELIISLVDEA